MHIELKLVCLIFITFVYLKNIYNTMCTIYTRLSWCHRTEDLVRGLWGYHLFTYGLFTEITHLELISKYSFSKYHSFTYGEFTNGAHHSFTTVRIWYTFFTKNSHHSFTNGWFTTVRIWYTVFLSPLIYYSKHMVFQSFLSIDDLLSKRPIWNLLSKSTIGKKKSNSSM